MQIGAVIAEYNPFHKGHQWQLEQIKKQGISHVAVIMSPDFTQRGTPAVFPKRVRAQAALQNGADLILELPVCYACAGAQGFALLADKFPIPIAEDTPLPHPSFHLKSSCGYGLQKQTPLPAFHHAHFQCGKSAAAEYCFSLSAVPDIPRPEYCWAFAKPEKPLFQKRVPQQVPLP